MIARTSVALFSGAVTMLVGAMVALWFRFRDHAGLSDASWAMMSKLNQVTSLGAGLIGYCPCPVNAAGNSTGCR